MEELFRWILKKVDRIVRMTDDLFLKHSPIAIFKPNRAGKAF
jgi:hypothetical protein